MILTVISRHTKKIAWFFLLLFYTQIILANRIIYSFNAVRFNSSFERNPIRTPLKTKKFLNENKIKKSSFEPVKKIEDRYSPAKDHSDQKQFIGGPSQPEMQAFQSVNANNIVDLFSGDFSYNIPLMDVGGYPVNLSYRGGISMDQEASWVGLGWNINPGTITRNLRGLPDDFNGKNDSIKKVTSIRENKTIGVTGGADLEITGAPIGVGASLGVFHNNYKGWGIENSVNASINSGNGSKGPLSGGLSITNNSQEGLTIAPSLTIKFGQYDAADKGTYGSFTTSLPYNSRAGIKAMQLSVGVTQFKKDIENQKNNKRASNSFSSAISFSSPTFVPSINMPFTSTQFSFTGKIGAEINAIHPDFFISGYVSKQRILPKDTLLAIPSYGYLYFQDGAKNRSALLDFNREKEMVYREKPAMPHIAVPFYTYDAFSITGEGTGGMFRAYRGDIGFVYDHFIRTKDESNRLSIDFGSGNLVHGGIDININRAFTQNGPWLGDNSLRNIIDFKNNSGTFEAAYFRNPGEKAINSKSYYDAIGGDDVVTVALYQAGISSSTIQATNYLTRYRNKREIGKTLLTPQNAIKPERDKRTQVISYLTAKEADAAGLSKYIENYAVNQFALDNCSATNLEDLEGLGSGLPAEYYKQLNFGGVPDQRIDATVNYNWGKNAPYTGFPADRFSIRRTGRIKAPVTGVYTFTTNSDDGVRLWLNDSLIINQWNDHGAQNNSAIVNLVQGQMYKIKMDYYENKGKAVIKLLWSYPGQSTTVPVPQQYLYPPAVNQYNVSSYLIKEKRVNSFRKENHISEIDVLNADGRRYVYGIPVYNFRQKEANFSVQGNTRGNIETGLVGYNHGIDNSTRNQNGKDWYFNSEETPAYAHSFLLTGILSPDYVDVTGNGISNDDLGDAVKFNYSKINGITNPGKWRAPYVQDSVTLNEGLKTDYRDDKGSYVYGEKEMWYLNSIESKTMVATFLLENRLDLVAIDEAGHKYNDGSAKRIKEINLYSRADFLKRGANARPIKTVHFEYTYELCKGVNKPLNDSGKLTLKQVWFSYNGNEKGKRNPYIFNYNTNNPDYNSKSYDRWGNYKNALQNPGSTTSNLITNAEYPYSLQDSILAAKNAAAWSLDSIYLPSGGSLKVDFESDDYAYVQNKTAMQLFKLVGLASLPDVTNPANQLYTSTGDNLYAYISVPQAVTSKTDVYQKYLNGVSKFYFKLYVKMPVDQFGNGSEYIPCYADIDANNYGYTNANTIWVKLKGISLKGDGDGTYSPLAKAAIQFLRLNLPSKAYPGSETADGLDLGEAVKMIFSLATNIKTAFQSFDQTARNNNWAAQIDTSRSFIRLNNPYYKKYGGGHRVKRVTIYDKWDKMTGQRAATYGKEYTYTTQKVINGINRTISSGVAAYEPGIGGEENPFHQPIEYVEKISALGPVTLGYSEEPLGESLFPSAGVGYSKIRVRTINYKNVKSANGYDETSFYTAYDFPVYTDRTLFDNDTKKRYKPALSNFLRINAKHYVALSQGFKIELNDMHGRVRSEASYAETDANNPVVYTENIYKVTDPKSDQKQLSNQVSVMGPDGKIDTAAVIGKDIELMMDMREQVSITNGNNINLNTDMFSLPFLPPFLVIPSFLNLAQREENQFRSVATLKVIQRYGILDSVIHIDKGSRISTKDLMYDSETGDVLLIRTQNEFNDPIYTFNYPSHWAYDGMGLAYKNINANYNHIQIRDGKIISGLPVPDSVFLSSGDEILIAGKQAIDVQQPNCTVPFATFPFYTRVWAIDSSIIKGGAKYFYLMNRDGTPYNGFDVSLKIIRSGRKNVTASIGSVSTLTNPLVKNGVTQQYDLILNTNSKVLASGVSEFKQTWSTANPVCSTKVKGCPVDYSLNPDNPNYCIKITTQPATIVDSLNICLANYTDVNYSACGSYIYSADESSCSRIDNNNFWVNVDGYTLGACQSLGNCILGGGNFMAIQNTSTGNNKNNNSNSGVNQDTVNNNNNKTPKLTANAKSGRPGILSADIVFPDSAASVMGPLNRSGIWLCQTGNPANYQPQYVYTGFTDNLYIPVTGTYYFGMGTDNRIHLSIDGQLVKQLDDADVLRNFEIWHIFPINLTQGTHTITVEGYNATGVALFGLEVYNNTEAEIRAATCYYGCPNGLDMIFSTIDAVGKTYYTYGCPAGFSLDGSTCKKIDSVASTESLQNISSNSYVDGRLGNWRGYRSYTYYGPRKETNPAAATNIRTDGTFNDYTPFWNFTSNQLKPQYDTTRWVWNNEMTLFNRKGLEIENKDPLGRYNSGVYGYDLTMPVAVTQNSHYNESAFESFEDYDYQTFNCDTCNPVRHFDIGINKSKIVTTQKHSGKHSLKIDPNQSIGLLFKLLTDTVSFKTALKFNTTTNACFNGLAGLQSVTVDTSANQVGFFPYKGKKMVISAWVKEEQDCSCISYVSNSIFISFTGAAQTYTFKPTGNIIEGWQRYESVFDIPSAATNITISLQATGTSPVYFDDLRVHPFNSNMKSFVYNSVDLRLMAELDENNYATFYEYDDDGTLIRVKKETQRGIKTINETRSALFKQ
jgi:PA14 domain